MSIARDRFRQLLESDVCTLAAPIFDSLSARIAHLEGWPVCKLNGSAAKAAHLGLPDDVALANMTDLAEICRAICRDPDISLIVDADDVGGGILNVKRGIEDLEAAGVCAIEVDDTSIPPTFRERDRRDARL